MIPHNFNISWHTNKMYELFNSNDKDVLYLNQTLGSQRILNPPLINLFRGFNINKNDVLGIIISDYVEVNSSGLACGSNNTSTNSGNNIINNLVNYIYPNSEEFVFDSTLSKWADQNILLMSVCINNIHEDKFIQASINFTNKILDNIHYELGTLPVLLLGDLTHLLNCKKHNTILGKSTFDREFQQDNCLVKFNNLLKISYNQTLIY